MNSEMMLRSTPQWLAHWAAISPDRPALVIENEGTVRYGEWAIAVARMAKWLRGAGVQAGMLVGIESANQYLHAVAMLGAETVGAYTVSFSSTDIADGDSAMQRCDWLLHETTPNPIAAAGRRVQINQAFIDTLAAIALTSDDLGALQKSSGPNTIVRVQRSSGTTGEKKIIGLHPVYIKLARQIQ